MPLSKKLIEGNCAFGLWTLDESFEEIVAYFDDAPITEKEDLQKFKNPSRQMERMSVRLLVYELLQEKPVIKYDQHGKPFFENDDRQISISHTEGMVAVQIGKESAGVDVEKISGRVAKIAHKFLSPTELKAIDLKNQLLHMYAYWGAKETIYKIYGRKRLDFKQNISVEPFQIKEKGDIIAHLKKEKSVSFNLDYFIYEATNGNKYMVVKHCR